MERINLMENEAQMERLIFWFDFLGDSNIEILKAEIVHHGDYDCGHFCHSPLTVVYLEKDSGRVETFRPWINEGCPNRPAHIGFIIGGRNF